MARPVRWILFAVSGLVFLLLLAAGLTPGGLELRVVPVEGWTAAAGAAAGGWRAVYPAVLSLGRKRSHLGGAQPGSCRPNLHRRRTLSEVRGRHGPHAGSRTDGAARSLRSHREYAPADRRLRPAHRQPRGGPHGHLAAHPHESLLRGTPQSRSILGTPGEWTLPTLAQGLPPSRNSQAKRTRSDRCRNQTNPETTAIEPKRFRPSPPRTTAIEI